MKRRIRFKQEKDSPTIFGIFCPQEFQGTLAIGVKPDEVMRIGQLTRDLNGKVVFIGSVINRDIRQKAEAIGVVGLLAGGMHYQDFTFGALPVCLLEGWGNLKVGEDLWELLTTLEGHQLRVKSGQEKEIKEIKPDAKVRLIGDPGPIGAQGRMVSWLGRRELFGTIKTEMVKVALEDRLVEVPVKNIEVI